MSLMPDSRETLTKNAFVAGSPIGHSRSPLIHTTWLKRYGIDGTYTAIDIKPGNLAAFLEGLRDGTQDYCGGNITIPHKEAACALADRVDHLAEEIGAANTLWLEDGKIHASNTDAYGFTANLDDRHPGWDKHQSAIVYGAGGASRAIVLALRDRGIGNIHILNRTVDKARQLADRFGSQVHGHPLQALGELLPGAGLFVNTTSLGLGHDPVPEIDFSPMLSDALVTDIVYVPLKTQFLQLAETCGFATVDGLGMLLHQAAPGFEKWFGVHPDVDHELRSLVEAAIGAR
jgi:shikimate dehydrogenase